MSVNIHGVLESRALINEYTALWRRWSPRFPCKLVLRWSKDFGNSEGNRGVNMSLSTSTIVAKQRHAAVWRTWSPTPRIFAPETIFAAASVVNKSCLPNLFTTKSTEAMTACFNGRSVDCSRIDESWGKRASEAFCVASSCIKLPFKRCWNDLSTSRQTYKVTGLSLVIVSLNPYLGFCVVQKPLDNPHEFWDRGKSQQGVQNLLAKSINCNRSVKISADGASTHAFDHVSNSQKG